MSDKHHITATHHTELIPEGESLELEYNEHHELAILDAQLMGPDTLYSYIIIQHEAPEGS
jgi:hypothetical protein